MRANESRPGVGTGAACRLSGDTSSIPVVTVNGVLVATVTDDDHDARMALWGVCEQAPTGAQLVIRPAGRVMPYGLFHRVPLLHLGGITVEAPDAAQLSRWVSEIRAQLTQQHAEQAKAEADRVRLEADLARADAAAEAWRVAHPEQVS